MKMTLVDRTLMVVICLLLFTLPQVHGEAAAQTNAAPEGMQAKLESLFQKYYPQAAAAGGAHVNPLPPPATNAPFAGFHFEYAVTNYHVIINPIKSFEGAIQKGPKPGGILCNISLQNGKYYDWRLMNFAPVAGGLCAETVADKQAFKQLLMIPYSTARDKCLRVSLAYPPDVSQDFLNEFRTIVKSFPSQQD